MLTSLISKKWLAERDREDEQDFAQLNPQPLKDEAEIVADGGEYAVGMIASAALRKLRPE